MSIQNELPELVKAGVITEDDALRINAWYQSSKTPPHKRLMIIFGVLGAILVGLGIILVIAHNWDQFPKIVKVILAFVPLLSGQILTAYCLLCKKSNTWKESSAAFLFFAVGASISLVSQVYNIPGNMRDFMLVWMLLCLPIIYVLDSSIASLLFLVGITYFANTYEHLSGRETHTPSWLYWPLLLGVLPHYYRLHKLKPKSNFLFFHNWVIAISLMICVTTLHDKIGGAGLTHLAYICLFSMFSVIGSSDFIHKQKTASNAWVILGALGTIIHLAFSSFSNMMKWMTSEMNFYQIISSQMFYGSLVFSLISLYLLNKQRHKGTNAFEWVFIPYYFIFVFGLSFPSAAPILVNILMLALGILTILSGARKDHLGVVNFGLLIIAVLVTCRFFDSDISFVIRGVMFMIVGIGFFVTNYVMLKKRRHNE